MAADAILTRLDAHGIRIRREGDSLVATPRDALTEELRGLIRAHKAELLAVLPANDSDDPLPDPGAEGRRLRVLAMLADRPGIRHAVLTDTAADPMAVIVALAIRGRATCELRIPRDKYDAFLLLDLIERHSGTIH